MQGETAGIEGQFGSVEKAGIEVQLELGNSAVEISGLSMGEPTMGEY